MAKVVPKQDAEGNKIFDVTLDEGESTVSLATADTYVDKNIVFNFDSDAYVLKSGDTMTGPLKFNTTQVPILDLHLNKAANNVYTMTTNGSLFIGDATSSDGARVYYARKVNTWTNLACLGAVSIGYNPLEQSHWQTSTDYGIKFDVNVASSNSGPTPSSLRQIASFHVGANGAVVGYSGSVSKPVGDNVFQVIDSNNISKNEYIVSLEQRIAALEAKITALEGANNDSEETV